MRILKRAVLAAGAFLGGRRLYQLVAAGELTLDTGIGRAFSRSARSSSRSQRGGRSSST